MKCKIIWFAALFVLSGLPIFAQETQVKLVKEIEVLETKRTNPEMIRRKMRTKVGEALGDGDLLRGVRRVVRPGRYASP